MPSATSYHPSFYDTNCLQHQEDHYSLVKPEPHQSAKATIISSGLSSTNRQCNDPFIRHVEHQHQSANARRAVSASSVSSPPRSCLCHSYASTHYRYYHSASCHSYQLSTSSTRYSIPLLPKQPSLYSSTHYDYSACYASTYTYSTTPQPTLDHPSIKHRNKAWMDELLAAVTSVLTRHHL